MQTKYIRVIGFDTPAPLLSLCTYRYVHKVVIDTCMFRHIRVTGNQYTVSSVAEKRFIPAHLNAKIKQLTRFYGMFSEFNMKTPVSQLSFPMQT